MNDNPVAFGDVLRKLRISASLSQEELARRAGLSLRGVSDLERGLRRSPHPTTIGALADVFALGPTDRHTLLAAARPDTRSEAPRSASGSTALLSIPRAQPVGRMLSAEQALTEALKFSDKVPSDLAS